MGDQRVLHIAEVADAVGLPLRVLRLYDDAGVAGPSSRDGEGTGLYSESDVERLRLVKRLRPLDLSLEELGDVVESFDELSDDGTGPERRRELVERLSRITAVAEERAGQLRDELAAVESITGELRRAVLRAGRQPSLHH